MATINVKDAGGATVAIEKPLPPNQSVMATSRPVVIASDQSDLPVKPGSTEVKVTAATIGAGGVGYVGWLSTIANYLAGTLTVATHAVTQSGTWTVQPGNTANTTAWKVDGSAATQPVSGTVSINAAQIGNMVTGDFTKATPTVPVENPTDQAVPIKVQAVANGTTSSRVNAAASTNATSLKASAGNVFQIDLFNVAAYDVFFKFYNKASAPTVGTDTPTWTIPIKAGTGFSVRFPFGKSFATGIAYATTKLQADSDTTVLVAGDVTGSIDWI